MTNALGYITVIDGRPIHALPYIIVGIALVVMLVTMAYSDDDKQGRVALTVLLFAAACCYCAWDYQNTPSEQVTRDCLIHKELRNTEYCDGVDYENGDNK